jgi:hypothetical protein
VLVVGSVHIHLLLLGSCVGAGVTGPVLPSVPVVPLVPLDPLEPLDPLDPLEPLEPLEPPAAPASLSSLHPAAVSVTTPASNTALAHHVLSKAILRLLGSPKAYAKNDGPRQLLAQ